MPALCRALHVSRSGYYAWLTRPESERARQDRRLMVHVRAAHAKGRGSYGVRRIYAELSAEGLSVGRERVRRLMRLGGLQVTQSRRRRSLAPIASTFEAPNVLARRFAAECPDVAWVADTTEFQTGEGTLYLSAVLDLYARRVVGWSAGPSMHRSLAVGALESALLARQPGPGLLHHSDRGSQYTSEDYLLVLTGHGAVASFSGRGQCLDNAVAESFFGTLKDELVRREHFASHEQAIAALAEWIDFYNHRRRHSRLGYRTPAEHEAAYHPANVLGT